MQKSSQILLQKLLGTTTGKTATKELVKRSYSNLPLLDVEHKIKKDARHVPQGLAAASLDLLEFNLEKETGKAIRLSIQHMVTKCPEIENPESIFNFLKTEGVMLEVDWPENLHKPIKEHGKRIFISDVKAYCGNDEIGAALYREPLLGSLEKHMAFVNYPDQGNILTFANLRKWDVIREGVSKCHNPKCLHFGETFLHFCQICGFADQCERLGIILCGVSASSWKVKRSGYELVRGEPWGFNSFAYIKRSDYTSCSKENTEDYSVPKPIVKR